LLILGENNNLGDTLGIWKSLIISIHFNLIISLLEIKSNEKKRLIMVVFSMMKIK
jgi:hypothetical protein